MDPIRLLHLSPYRAERVLADTPRLLVPVGTLTPRGPHLPLGFDTIVLDRLTDDLSGRTGIPRAPAIAFGVHGRTEDTCPGGASLSRKTLHRIMNELIESWETGAKVLETIILTAHPSDAHLEALSTIRTSGSVRLIDVFDTAAARGRGKASAEADTALLLALAPELVDRNRLPSGMDPQPSDGRHLYETMVRNLALRITDAAA